jgi:GNAT superfamily N-acetyltransferase
VVEGTRPAVAADVATIAGLCRDALAAMAQWRGGVLYRDREARPEPLEASFSADLDSPDRTLLVGTIDDVVVGYASCRGEGVRDGTRLGVITDLYVEPGAREVGIGELLMAAIVEWCKTQGCAAIDGHALPGDRNTKNFFEASGFTARLLVVHHRLDRS